MLNGLNFSLIFIKISNQTCCQKLLPVICYLKPYLTSNMDFVYEDNDRLMYPILGFEWPERILIYINLSHFCKDTFLVILR